MRILYDGEGSVLRLADLTEKERSAVEKTLIRIYQKLNPGKDVYIDRKGQFSVKMKTPMGELTCCIISDWGDIEFSGSSQKEIKQAINEFKKRLGLEKPSESVPPQA